MSSTVNPCVSLVVANCAEHLHTRCRHPNVRIHWWQLVRRKRGQQFQWMESRLGSLVASMFCRKNTHVSAFIKTFNRHGGTYFSVRQTTNLNQFVTYCLGIGGVFAKGRCNSKGFSTFAGECSCPMSAMDFVARSVWACILYARRVWCDELTWAGSLSSLIFSVHIWWVFLCKSEFGIVWHGVCACRQKPTHPARLGDSPGQPALWIVWKRFLGLMEFQTWTNAFCSAIQGWRCLYRGHMGLLCDRLAFVHPRKAMMNYAQCWTPLSLT